MKNKSILFLALLIFTYPFFTIAQTNIFPSTGFTGIYTTSPQYPLDVLGAARVRNILRITPSVGATNEGGEIKLESPATYANWHIDSWSGFLRGFTTGAANPSFMVSSTGNFGIGMWDVVDERLHVQDGNIKLENGEFFITSGASKNFSVDMDGYVKAREIEVLADTIPDYVFSEDYGLMTLAKLRDFIHQNHHLPNIPSEKQVAENNGYYNVGELNLKLLEKVEELTLYILELEERIASLENETK